MKFQVTFRKENGSEEKRTVEAANRFSVYQDAEKAGETVTQIQEVRRSISLNLTFGTGVKVMELITFTKNLGAMLSAGLTLSRALSVIERQSGNKMLKKVVVDLQAKVRGGLSFHESLAAHPKLFSKLFVAMTKSGEESGTLAESLKVIARQMERSHTLTKKIRGAMLYPGIILFAIVVIGILMLVYVVPTLANTFLELGVELPTSTRIILGISSFMVNNFILVIIGLIALVVLMVLAIRSRAGAAIFAKVALRLPVIGMLMKETYSARAARTLSSLLSSGVEMLTALSITA
jgi:type IV pilus assembly protein PilC